MTEEKFYREDALNLITGVGARSYIADHFAKYAHLPYLGRFLMRYELFKQIMLVSGSIIECGVRSGAGLLEWYQISKLMEPLNRRRIVYGFDTFNGFPNVSERDGPEARVGDQRDNSYDDLCRAITMHQLNDLIMHHDQSNWLRPKKFQNKYPWLPVVPIRGDFKETAAPFMKENQHLVVALLYLDFDLYEPTKLAIETFLPRMPRGSIIAFDELDHADWPGETLALLETIGIRNLELRRFPWEQTMAYAVLT